MPKLCHRSKTLEAIRRSAVHQSLSTPASQLAMARSKTATLSDPVQAIEMLRSLLQNSINEEIKKVLSRFRENYFVPAARNARNNLGKDNVSVHLVDQVCINALEQAKVIYSVKKVGVYNSGSPYMTQQQQPQQSTNHAPRAVKRGGNAIPGEAKKAKVEGAKTDLILVYKSGRPVRREGPKWDATRLKDDTMFILGSKANKALGFGQTRGRLYIKHPELFKYSGDQEDKEWLAKNQLMSTTGGKAYLMVLSDIVELASMPEYASNPRQQPEELIGFQIPDFLLAKMRCFMSTVRTPSQIADNQLIQEGERQMAIWEEERKKLQRGGTKNNMVVVKVEQEATVKEEEQEEQDHQDQCSIVSSIPSCSGNGNLPLLNGNSESHLDEDPEELGFLHGMNLNNLVRELEMETGNGSGNLESILSLADDDDEAQEAFPELSQQEKK